MIGGRFLSFHIFSLILLPLSIGFLICSVLNNTPWYRLIIKKSENNKLMINHKSSPIFLSTGGIGTNSLLDDNINYNIINNEENNNELNNYLLISFWSLQTVTIIIPDFNNYTKTFPINQLPQDPLIKTVLKFTGVYDELIDIQSANRIVITLGTLSIPLIILATLIAFIFSLVECCRSCNRHTVLPNQLNLSEHFLPQQILHQEQNDVIIRESRRPMRRPFIANGILTLIASVCLSIGIGSWVTRSLNDSKELIEALKIYFGKQSVQWLTSHLYFIIDLGLLEYISTLGLLLVVSFMNLCVNYSKIYHRHVHYYYYERPTSNINYQPPAVSS